jgi:PAS domain-containing protein
MSPSDPRLERLFGDGASAFREAFDLRPTGECEECSRRGRRTWSRSRWRPAMGRSGACAGSSCTARSRSAATGVLNLVTDVTERRRMEDELRDYANVAAHDPREPIMAAG